MILKKTKKKFILLIDSFISKYINQLSVEELNFIDTVTTLFVDYNENCQRLQKVANSTKQVITIL